MMRELLRKEILLFLRTPLMLGMNLMYPLVILLVLPWATNMDIDSLNTLVIDQDGSSLSQELTNRFVGSGYFVAYEKVVCPTQEEQYALMESGEIDVILSIPKGTELGIMQGESQKVEIVVNAINATKGALAQAYSQYIVAEYVKELASSGASTLSAEPIETSSASLFNPQHSYKSFVIPGLITIIICLTALVMPAVGLVQEKEFGTIEQLNVTPVKGWMVVVSKSVLYWVINVLSMPLYILLVGVIFGLWPAGSFWGILLATLLFSITFSGVGLIIANFSSRLQQMMFSVIFVNMISMLMSGLFTPVSGMPAWARGIAYAMPLTYYIDAIRSFFLRGSSIGDMWLHLVILTGFAILLYGVALLSYRKRVKA